MVFRTTCTPRRIVHACFIFFVATASLIALLAWTDGTTWWRVAHFAGKIVSVDDPYWYWRAPPPHRVRGEAQSLAATHALACGPTSDTPPPATFANFTFILSLKNSLQKRNIDDHLLPLLPGAVVFPAVDGSKVTPGDVASFVAHKYISLPYSFWGLHLYENTTQRERVRNKKIANHMSMVRIWEQLQRSSLPFFLVIEDDARLHEHFFVTLRHVLCDLSDLSWDIAFLSLYEPIRRFAGTYTFYLPQAVRWIDFADPR